MKTKITQTPESRKQHTVACPIHNTFAVCGFTALELAAPDLLEAVKKALEIVGNKTSLLWDYPTQKILEQAIAKAEGK